MASPVCGLILVGNSGVGKSFLANCLLDDDQAFASRYSAKSVTRQTEWKDMAGVDAGGPFYAVANIPGLIEADQRLLDQNRHEIMKAFDLYPHSIVLFVFGHRNGRIPDEDLIAFERIDAAYKLARQSLVLIVNGIPLDRPEHYGQNTVRLLSKLTHVKKDRIYFIEQNKSDESRQLIRDFLLEIVRRCEPAHHPKQHDIQLVTDEIAQLKSQSKQRQQQLIAQQDAIQNSREKPMLPVRQLYRAEQSIPLIRERPPTEQSIASSESDRQFTERMAANKAKFDQNTARIVTALHQHDNDLNVQTAQQIKINSDRNRAEIARLSVLPPQTAVIAAERKHERVLRFVQQGFDHFLDFCGIVPSGPEQSNPLCGGASLREHAGRDEQPVLPPHSYDPRSCKH